MKGDRQSLQVVIQVSSHPSFNVRRGTGYQYTPQVDQASLDHPERQHLER
jgi:hypothetical protein